MTIRNRPLSEDCWMQEMRLNVAQQAVGITFWRRDKRQTESINNWILECFGTGAVLVWNILSAPSQCWPTTLYLSAPSAVHQCTPRTVYTWTPITESHLHLTRLQWQFRCITSLFINYLEPNRNIYPKGVCSCLDSVCWRYSSPQQTLTEKRAPSVLTTDERYRQILVKLRVVGPANWHENSGL